MQRRLNVTEPTTPASPTGTSNLKVIPRAEEQPPLPTMSGSCAPFKSNPNSDTILSCPNLKPVNADGKPSTDEFIWAWRITRTGENQRITTQLGKTPNFGKLPEANFIVAAAVGWKGPPTSSNTIPFLSSYLVVSPNNPPSTAAAPATGSSPRTPGQSPSPKPPGSSPSAKPAAGSPATRSPAPGPKPAAG